jgi:gliding motility-associated-like protein
MDTIIKEINIPDKFSIYVPNTFTPNQDKSNEVFYPVISKAIISDSYEFKIYDRWGELVFESRDRTKGWNGFYGNKLAPDGTYIWKLSVIDDVSKARKEFIGHVNLLK